jgi:hypothetical protein
MGDFDRMELGRQIVPFDFLSCREKAKEVETAASMVDHTWLLYLPEWYQQKRLDGKSAQTAPE